MINGIPLVPSIVWMELKCKRPDKFDITLRRDELVVHRPRAMYQTFRHPDRYEFIPVGDDPHWQIARGFTPGTYVLEAFTQPEGGESLFMWDLHGQEAYRVGDPIIPDVCIARH